MIYLVYKNQGKKKDPYNLHASFPDGPKSLYLQTYIHIHHYVIDNLQNNPIPFFGRCKRIWQLKQNQYNSSVRHFLGFFLKLFWHICTLRQSYRLCDCQAIHRAWIATGEKGDVSFLVFNVTVQGSHSWTLDIDVCVSMTESRFPCIYKKKKKSYSLFNQMFYCDV